MILPQMGIIRQQYDSEGIDDVQGHVQKAIEEKGLFAPIRPGQSVMITAGSRGIACMKDVLAACILGIRDRGAEPIIFPAMGSHGRGEAVGQVELLAHLGITEDTLGAKVYADMEMVTVGTVNEAVPVYTDRAVAEADHVLLVNRIKEHTEYIGETESGILKMAVVGLGRHLGAQEMHRLAVNISYRKAIASIAGVLFRELPILGAVGILENECGQLRRVEAMTDREVPEKEPELLKEAARYKAKLPFDPLDILIVDEIGKEISGTGVDTKMVGRIMNIYERDCETPNITRILIRDLSDKTAGNAIGIGLADFTTRRAVEKIDYQALNLNCIVAVTPEKGRIPITLETDRDAIEASLDTIGRWTPETVKVAWIQNSAAMETLAVSKALVDAAAFRSDLSIEGTVFDLPFDEEGNLPKLSRLLNR